MNILNLVIQTVIAANAQVVITTILEVGIAGQIRIRVLIQIGVILILQTILLTQEVVVVQVVAVVEVKVEPAVHVDQDKIFAFNII